MKPMHGSVSLPDIRELAMELVQLGQNRPVQRIPLNPNTSIYKINPAFTEHLQKEFALKQEMKRRCGPDYTEVYLEQARFILKLLS